MSTKQEIFTLMGGRVRIHRGHYNPTSDAVWLAAFAPNNARTVLDVGIGTGGVSLCYLANNPTAEITGIDTSVDMLHECEQNAILNDASIETIEQDINTWRTNRTFDLVLTNPPYFNGTPAKHNAHHNADLRTWISRCIARVRPMGTFCIITDATTIALVISEMSQKLGDITIFPLFGAKNTAERVLISGKLGTKGISILHHGLPMNYEPILRNGLTIADTLSTLSQK
ncbi:MAG: methyltransferase [Alphaproteobacteria bacterium]|nr:methyltransferase [Alphaproteobacteria bacterium]MBQ8256187.1 methyltransferase [Alphaproteobacteria bacterium]